MIISRGSLRESDRICQNNPSRVARTGLYTGKGWEMVGSSIELISMWELSSSLEEVALGVENYR